MLVGAKMEIDVQLLHHYCSAQQYLSVDTSKVIVYIDRAGSSLRVALGIHNQ